MSFSLDDTAADAPAKIEVDPKLAMRFERQFTGCIGMPVGYFLKMMGAGTELDRLREHAEDGDCCAAVVVAVNPVIVAAYSDELDDVALLKFQHPFIEELGMTVGTSLVTANSYFVRMGRTHADDVIRGEHSRGEYVNFHPVILNFITSDGTRLEELRAAIPQSEWDRAYELGVSKLAAHPGHLRNGSPFLAMQPLVRKR